jgi:hypothetical protein
LLFYAIRFLIAVSCNVFQINQIGCRIFSIQGKGTTTKLEIGLNPESV